MKRTVYKWFWMWDFDKEEKWLNEMAANGYALSGVGYCKYDFEEGGSETYSIRLEMLEKAPGSLESQNYIRFLEDTGAEHVGSIFRWVYFRKKPDGAPFDLFSDIDSRIRHLNRMLFIPEILGIVNLINAANWTMRFINGGYGSFGGAGGGGNGGDLLVALACWAVAALMAYGFAQIYRKKQKLQKERVLHE